MKTISDYTIYCTKSQTKKALELGAPIDRQSASSNAPFVQFGEERGEYGQKVGKYYNCPTAEQMIGWLETIIEELHIFCTNSSGWHYEVWTKLGMKPISSLFTKGFFTRKEATLAAIDATLEYLTNFKNKN